MSLYDIYGNIINVGDNTESVSFKYIWSQGGIASATGICNASSKNRIKTLDYIHSNVINVTSNSAYEMSLFAFDKDSYVGCWDGTTFVQTGITWHSAFDIAAIKTTYPFYKFKISARLKADTELTIDAYSNFIFTITKDKTNLQIVETMNGLVDVYAAKRQLINPLVTSNMYTNDMKQFAMFVHTSDMHGDWERYEKAVLFSDYIGADAFCDTGDFVWYYSTDRSDFVEDIVKHHNTEFHMCLGNHDMFSISSEQAAYNKYVAPFADHYDWTTDSEVDYPTYYYKDLTSKKIRIISVNQYQFSNQIGTMQVCYHQEQIDFFCNALLNTPSGYGVIVLIHGVETTPAESSGYTKFKCATTRYGGVQSSPIYQIVDAFISGTSINKTINNGSSATPSSYNINADFSSKNSNVEFIAYMSGHLHTDNVFYISEATNKQLMLNVCCGNAFFNRNKTYITKESQNDNPYSNEGNDLGREVGTPSEDAFNVYCIDRTNKQVKIVRIGSRLTYDFSKNRDYMSIPYAD